MAQLGNHSPRNSVKKVTKEEEMELLEQNAPISGLVTAKADEVQDCSSANARTDEFFPGYYNIAGRIVPKPKITLLVFIVLLTICGLGAATGVGIWKLVNHFTQKSSNDSLDTTTAIFVNPALNLYSTPTTVSKHSTAATQSQTAQPTTTDYSSKSVKYDLEHEGEVSTICPTKKGKMCVTENCSSPASIIGKWTTQNNNGLCIDAKANSFKILGNMTMKVHIEFSIYHRLIDMVGLSFSINGVPFDTCVYHRSSSVDNPRCNVTTMSAFYRFKDFKLVKSMVNLNITKVNFVKSDIITVEFIGDDNATCISDRPSITFTLEIL